MINRTKKKRKKGKRKNKATILSRAEMRSNFVMYHRHRNANESKQSTLVKIQKHPPTIGTLNRKKIRSPRLDFQSNKLSLIFF